MTQTVFSNIVASTKSGTALAADLNAFKDSLLSSHAGTDRPSYATEGTIWIDQVSATVRDYYLFDGTSDIKILTYNPSAHTFSFPNDSISAANLGDDVVSGQTLVTAASTDTVLIADDSDSDKVKQALISDIVALAIAAASPPSGSVIQTVTSQDGAVATGTTVLPYDNTIPQNTEGNQYLSATITASNASNKFLITVVAELNSSAAVGSLMSGALFIDSATNALAAVASTVNQSELQLVLTHYMAAGDTAAHTFKFRAGASAAGTTTFNGRSGNQRFNGVSASRITIQEIKA